MAHWGIKISVPLTINPSWPVPDTFALTLTEPLLDISVKSNDQQEGHWKIQSNPESIVSSLLRGLKLSGGDLQYEKYLLEVNCVNAAITDIAYTEAMAMAAGLFASNECRKEKLDLNALSHLYRENIEQGSFAADCICALSGGIQYSYRIDKHPDGFRIYSPGGLKVVLLYNESFTENRDKQTVTGLRRAKLLPAVLYSLERFDIDRLRRIHRSNREEIFGNEVHPEIPISFLESSAAVMYGCSTGNQLLYVIFENSVDSDAFISDLEKSGWNGQILRSELSNEGAKRH